MRKVVYNRFERLVFCVNSDFFSNRHFFTYFRPIFCHHEFFIDMRCLFNLPHSKCPAFYYSLFLLFLSLVEPSHSESSFQVSVSKKKLQVFINSKPNEILYSKTTSKTHFTNSFNKYTETQLSFYSDCFEDIPGNYSVFRNCGTKFCHFLGLNFRPKKFDFSKLPFRLALRACFMRQF